MNTTVKNVKVLKVLTILTLAAIILAIVTMVAGNMIASAFACLAGVVLLLARGWARPLTADCRHKTMNTHNIVSGP